MSVTPRHAHATPQTIGTGILYMLAGVMGLGVLTVIVKLLAARYSIAEIAFFRCLVALAPASMMVAVAGGVRTLRTRHFWSHARRASIGVVSMGLMFWSYQLLPLADAVTIGFSAPLFLTALSVPLLGERVGFDRWVAVLAGFAGVLISLKPSAGVLLHLGTVVALSSAVAYAFAMIAIRHLSRTERSSTIIFYFTLNASLLLALALPIVWETPSLFDFGLMVLTGLMGGVTQHCVTRAYTLAPASVIAPFNYASLLWAMLFGYLVWGDVPDHSVALGAAIVIGSGLAIVYRETRQTAGGAAPQPS